MVHRNYIHFTGIIILLFFSACEDLIDVGNPRTQLVKDVVFEDDLTATSAVSGLYSGLTAYSGSYGSVTYLAALSADEMMMEGNSAHAEFYQNAILSTNTNINSFWNSTYSEIYKANLILEGLHNSVNITPSLKNQLTGEAKFFRAFHHFYLVNLFGAVPYITGTDYKVNSLAHRTPVDDIYALIATDLIDAKALLSEDYSYSKDERVRVNKWAATALLARVYLYQKEWALAEEQASVVLSKTSLYSLTALNQVFLKNSSETIWQLIPPSFITYTLEGGAFIVTIYSAGLGVMNENLFETFEPGDNRLNEWVQTISNATTTWHYPVKYKENSINASGKEYSTVFRLAEMYLVRAEARAQQDKLTGVNGADSDLNAIRNRAGLMNTTATTQSQLLNAIAHERRTELFTEWGHRWLDLKRKGEATTVLPPIKPAWNDTDVLYPIPLNEWQLNPNLGQNPGY